jgi:hypothetical protein
VTGRQPGTDPDRPPRRYPILRWVLIGWIALFAVAEGIAIAALISVYVDPCEGCVDAPIAPFIIPPMFLILTPFVLVGGSVLDRARWRMKTGAWAMPMRGGPMPPRPDPPDR